MRVLTWNLEWAPPGSRREGLIRSTLAAAGADLICLTEAFAASLPDHGHIIEAGMGNLVADRKSAKKVLLWSRSSWSEVNTEDTFTPLGRIVSGVTTTELGRLRIFGVCIPWASSNTPRFGGNQQLWEDHLTFLNCLRLRLSALMERTVVLGDFNQRLPRRTQPARVANALEQALANMAVSTRTFASGDGHDTIDHIAHTPDLQAAELNELTRHRDGVRLSDHFGVVADLTAA